MSTVYKDCKSGGSVITERLYIDIKQDLKKNQNQNQNQNDQLRKERVRMI